MPIAVARRKIHRGIYPSRVTPQRLLDDAQALNKIPPINRAQQPQARDAVAHGDLVRRLRLCFEVYPLFYTLSLLRQALFNP